MPDESITCVSMLIHVYIAHVRLHVVSKDLLFWGIKNSIMERGKMELCIWEHSMGYNIGTVVVYIYFPPLGRTDHVITRSTYRPQAT